MQLSSSDSLIWTKWTFCHHSSSQFDCWIICWLGMDRMRSLCRGGSCQCWKLQNFWIMIAVWPGKYQSMQSCFRSIQSTLQWATKLFECWSPSQRLFCCVKNTWAKFMKSSGHVLWHPIFQFKKNHVIWTRIEQTGANTKWQHTWTVLLLPVLNLK